MFKRFICLISFVVMLALTGNASADLVVHWSLEDGSGTIATDVSGNGNDGTFNGAPEWVDGYFGGGLHFRGDTDADSVVYTIPGGATVWEAGTIAIWVKADSLGQDNYSSCFTNHTPNTAGIQFDVDGGDPGNYRLNPGGQFFGPATTEWTHLALTFEAGTGTFYYNGEEATTAALSDSQRTFIEFAIGINRNHTNWLAGIIDELRIYDHALTADEIQVIMESAAGKLPHARRPDPADGAMLTDTWVSLSWMPGDLTVSHDVYFGENFDDVNDATRDSDVFRGNQTGDFYVAGFPGYAYPEGLVPGTTYYWRIDEVNDADPNSPWKGDVWSFWIPPRKAYNPGPFDGLEYIDPNVTFSWTPGFQAKLHYVYFGDNFEDVNSAAGGLPTAETTYSPGTLELEKTYYWRIDEFDGAATNKGDVWSFTTIPVIPITSDPSLVAWWTLNEGVGATVVDWSGYGHHGTIEGSTFWAEGYDLGALEFTGPGDFVEMAGYGGVNGTNPRTMTAWIKTTTPNRTILSWGLNVAGQKWRMRSDATGGLRGEVNGGYHYGVTNIADGRWHHVAITFEDDGTPDALDLMLYVDGQLDATSDILDEPIDTSDTGVVRIGESPWHNAPFVGLIDDVRIYDKALTQEDIQLVMRIDPLLAWNASPANGAIVDIDNAMPLTWSPGDMASQHDVYFGTDKDAVANADSSDTTGIYRASQAGTSFTPSEGVEWGGGPYYWRVDENNTDGTVTEGRIWSFTVADFILIDDFESYDANDNQIWYAWHDGLGYGAPGTDPYFAGNGTGAAVGDETTASYTEETIVNGGGQSMPLSYDNNKQGFAKYSETELALTAPRDWAKHDLAELSLWFHGQPASVGSFVESPAGTYTITATGTDIWGTADEFHFAFKMLTGAGLIVARVESVEQTNNWAKAGVMIRETLDAGSKFAAVYITPTNADGTSTNGCRFQARTETDASATSDTSVATAEQTAIIAPYWVKLERDVGGNFRGYYSANGSTWQSMSWNPQSISMSSNVYVGLALTSHDAALTCQAEFSNVTITGTAGPQWTNQDIGIESNAAEALYVALSNTAGTPAVIYHDDANAATIDAWTEWIIPLQAFADQGINLADIDRIAIGLGTRGNMTTPGGSGKMFFDDIRLYQQRDDEDDLTPVAVE
jgi:hypothetical protein